MSKKLTGDQIAELKPYEENMRTAVKSDWTRGIGRHGIETMKRIRAEVTGNRAFVNTSCPVCVLSLVREVGRLYFAAVEAAEKAAGKAKGDGKGKSPSAKGKAARAEKDGE